MVPQEPLVDTPHLRIREEQGYVVLEFHGEIDIVAAMEILPHIDARVTGQAPRVLIDLSAIEFFDCSGLRLLYRARARTLEREGELRLVCVHPLTLRVLRATGLSKLLPPAPSVETALGKPGETL
ncbi:anti-sigma factor antagonist [Streptomyces roseirectus]|uniref:Anti-sigma factor antagonist n=1 Tax=Streptomyces roseirectus TaxID=2768066 RepID=A0A7H0INV2_9ACTN|nr:anti-sigma factor antagonist [Streptomyces roseirectus]QNP74468.1 anti-sigma factor antagonist [Streptomyces roseirectus]